MPSDAQYDPIEAVVADLPPLVPRLQLAELLGICDRTLDRMLRRGELRGITIARRVQIPRSEVARLLRAALEAA